MLIKLRAVCLLRALASLHGAVAASAPVRTQEGLVQGVEQPGLNVYEGVPFAAPPVGQLRWRAPQPAKSWTGLLTADAFRLRCMQAGSSGPGSAEDDGCRRPGAGFNRWAGRLATERPMDQTM